jgi:uncharacterized membrane protein
MMRRCYGETVADLMRRGLETARAAEVSRSARTGLPVITLGTTISTEDVRALDDDQ